MLNTQKLLYILPDVAYVAELLPGKKPTTFAIQAFRQINGEFLDDNEFLGDNLVKLVQKLDPEEYHLILPDFLFTNTIVSVNEKSDTKIKAHLKEKLLPELEITPETHHIDTTILTEHGDSTKVQLSALEKSVLIPLQIAVEQSKVKIAGISPLSWTIKSFVSLEPSISVVQMGSMLYTALHYIGIDQCTQANVDEVENIFETIKTLKGAEPSIQTVYLLSNDLVEEKLKEHLSDTLPIQQLANHTDDDSKMPSYVQKAIEAGMRTLSIDDYPVPNFELGKAPAGAVMPVVEKHEEEEESSELPKPSPLAAPAAVPAAPVVAAAGEMAPEISHDSLDDEPAVMETEEVAAPDPEPEPVAEEPAMTAAPETPEVVPADRDDEIDALLEALQTEEEVVPEPPKATPMPAQPAPATPAPTQTSSAPVIKNNNRTRAMLKMVFVTLAVFFATVGVGIGLGLGVLQLSQGQEPKTQSPIVEASPSPIPSPSPSPSASPAASLNKKELSVLVVNATTKAGYAGVQGKKLSDDGFGTVKSGNAKGEYEEGDYVLMKEKNQVLIDELEKVTGLTLTYQADQAVEDAKGEYDAVLVLAQ